MAEFFIGLMSGTSVNAVDAVVADLAAAQPCLAAFHEQIIPDPLRAQLIALNQPIADELNIVAGLDSKVARILAQAVTQLLAKAGISAQQVRAIGSHGQTIRHAPNAQEPYTVQIGNPSLIAELTGICTVADFRRRDIAAGGQGAPLAPVFHAAFLQSSERTATVVNIGGIANITILPADRRTPVTGFDTGPGNALLDAWAERHLGIPLDRDGAWAQTGQIIEPLLSHCLGDAYFAKAPPKSTGRETFNLDWLERSISVCAGNADPVDIQATLTALTADSIARAVKTYAADAECVLVCGGGVHNPVIMKRLQQVLGPLPVASTASAGIDPDYMEALGFAWLAKRTLDGLPGNLPTVTGAAGARILGGIYPA